MERVTHIGHVEIRDLQRPRFVENAELCQTHAAPDHAELRLGRDGGENRAGRVFIQLRQACNGNNGAAILICPREIEHKIPEGTYSRFFQSRTPRFSYARQRQHASIPVSHNSIRRLFISIVVIIPYHTPVCKRFFGRYTELTEVSQKKLWDASFNTQTTGNQTFFPLPIDGGAIFLYNTYR